MERTLISWNVPNIISIWLMALTGFLVAGLVVQLWRGGGGSLFSGMGQSGSSGATISTGGSVDAAATGTGGF